MSEDSTDKNLYYIGEMDERDENESLIPVGNSMVKDVNIATFSRLLKTGVLFTAEQREHQAKHGWKYEPTRMMMLS